MQMQIDAKIWNGAVIRMLVMSLGATDDQVTWASSTSTNSNSAPVQESRFSNFFFFSPPSSQIPRVLFVPCPVNKSDTGSEPPYHHAYYYKLQDKPCFIYIYFYGSPLSCKKKLVWRLSFALMTPSWWDKPWPPTWLDPACRLFVVNTDSKR